MRKIIEIIEKIIKWIYSSRRVQIYTGKGYLQGTGFDLSFDEVTIFGLKFVRGVYLDTSGSWLTKLRYKLEEEKMLHENWIEYMKKENGEDWKEDKKEWGWKEN